jgi:CDP-paratose 2-epimerase
MLCARERAGELAGTPFTMGGGAENAVSLLEVLELIGELTGREPELRSAEERAGDQRYYVADSSRFRAATGWSPLVGAGEGIERLVRWLEGNRAAPRRLQAVAR